MMIVRKFAVGRSVTSAATALPVALPSLSLARSISAKHASLLTLSLTGRQQQQRPLSFFSNLFGIQQKRLEKSTPKEEESAVARLETKKTKKIEGSKHEATKTRKPVSLQEERIIGGNYPARGPAMPEKRLKEWSLTVENLTVTPSKLNLVCKLIRKLPVEDARNQLRFSKKAVSRDVLLALDQVCMQARSQANIHIKDLIVGQAYVGGKIIGHKIDIKARGKSGKITKKVSHLNIILYENPTLVSGFKSRTLTPKQYQQEKRAEYRKRQEAKVKADQEQEGVFKLIA